VTSTSPRGTSGIWVLSKTIPDFLLDVLDLTGQVRPLRTSSKKVSAARSRWPLGEAKTKASCSNYQQNKPPVLARQAAEVAQVYLKRTARID